jgi:large subunit ribosomal protein L32
MAVPRKRHTKRRTNNRRKAIGHGQVKRIHLAKCANCATRVFPHAVCYNCGFYRGKKVLNKLAA